MSEIGRLIRSAGEEALAPHHADQALQGESDTYTLETVIGQGGMGATVYLAQTSHGERVALKLLPEEFAENPRLAKRFAREAKLMRGISHRHIVRLLDAGQTESGKHFIVMEYVPTGTLSQRIAKGTRLGIDESAAIMVKACRGLAKMHRHGIVHRDIKPSNILIDEHGWPKLCDFGLAKFLRSSQQSSPLTGDGEVVGTYGFMAPEQLAASAEVDHRADIYSLGAVMYFLLTGTVPSGNVSPPSNVNQAAAPFDSPVMRALATEPAKRFQSAVEMGEAFAGASGTQGTLSRRTVVVGGIATVAMAGIGGATWLARGGFSEFWTDIDAAQAAMINAGEHEVALRLPDRTIRFAISLSSGEFRLDPLDVPQSFLKPIRTARLAELVSSGTPPGLLGRLALQSLRLDAPDIFEDQPSLRLANLSVAAASDGDQSRFLRGYRLLDQLNKQSMLRIEGSSEPRLTLDPGTCPDFESFCKVLGYRPDTISQLSSDEGQTEALLRVASYEVLRHDDGAQHPAIIDDAPFTASETLTHSRLRMLGAIIAEKWLFENPQRATWFLPDARCLYDASLGQRDPQNKLVTEAAENLLGFV